MPPKRFEGKFGIPSSHNTESQLTSALYRLPGEVRPEHIEEVTTELITKVNKGLQEKGDEALSTDRARMFHLKLARHFQESEKAEHLDTHTLIDALVETPRFLDSDRGSIDKLLEIHEVKTLQHVAELRRQRAEMTGNETFNPYEALFPTNSGTYYMARLLNMPHLQEESQYMSHCVGTSDSYVNKMKRGEVEILSFRNARTHQPVVTIEYDLKSKQLLQIKGPHDRVPQLGDSYAPDLLEALEKLPTSTTEAGEPRIVSDHVVGDMRTLSRLKTKFEKQEPLTRDELVFLYEINTTISCFDNGRDPVIDELLQNRNVEADLPIIFDCTPDNIAHVASEVTSDTKAYIGPLEPGIFDKLPGHLEHVYTKFPKEHIKFRHAELGTNVNDGYSFKNTTEEQGMRVGNWAQQLLESADFKVIGERQQVDLVEVFVRSLGFTTATRYDQICSRAKELGLELCPAEVGPQLRLQYKDQPLGEYLIVAMKAISVRDGHPRVFTVDRGGGGLWLSADRGRPDGEWGPGHRFVFLRPRK
ncbi:hypothetical protein A3G63_01095 [Candidatus Kaiserbacteria bacterium RIFCSPLOWO2_12_FULL_52_8]|uniref:Uncharacterized protein n=1 Tax=Candidatus Kaiserbacteria bacterium RIFCSPHIGHO2_01_FULL_53_31 TaxID=1798481 RepID=A0A1F6CIW4_9BACT|nr:MAG: hypothetical protein A2678_00840 [Candidatus Kaiserbacteria bacterium RIFCSPHIGHO2_01_FULL_53_31]OGG94531.1 MAG: hypothetical protein A3G63_01095 [Candidatus Kaiserbacteria bacterium RIFCSPLOWO2_12_FULL_52_8]